MLDEEQMLDHSDIMTAVKSGDMYVLTVQTIQVVSSFSRVGAHLEVNRRTGGIQCRERAPRL